MRRWTYLHTGGDSSAAAADNAGDVMVTGDSSDDTYCSYATIKHSSAGIPIRTNPYRELGDISHGYAVVMDKAGNAIVTGISDYDNYDAECLTIMNEFVLFCARQRLRGHVAGPTTLLGPG